MLKRSSLSFALVAAMSAAAYAQPAPAPAVPTTPPPASDTPPAEGPATPPTTGQPDTSQPDVNQVQPPAPEPTPDPDKKKDEEKLPKKLSVGKESKTAYFTPGLLMQGWFVQDVTSTKKADGSDDAVSPLSTFRLRRAEVSVNGEIVPKFIKYRVMFDPSRVRDTLTKTSAVDSTGKAVSVSTPVSALSTMQDFYVTFQSEYADVSIGQFKIPVSWEGYNSSSKLILPERAFSSTVFGDKRDLGVRIEKTFDKVGYLAGVFNGAGQNNFDNNNQKDLALRIEVYPVKGLTIAAMTYDSVGYRSRAGTKDRWEGDLRYEANNFLFQGEFIRAQDVTVAGATECANAAGKCSSQGAYAAIGYTLKDLGEGHWKGALQPIVRVGFYDPDADHGVDANTTAANARMDYEVGLNYYLRAQEAKFQLSYDRQQYSDSDLRPANNEIIFATQLSF